MENMAVVAPIPSARVSTAMMLKAGLLRSCRRVYFRSCFDIVMGRPGGWVSVPVSKKRATEGPIAESCQVPLFEGVYMRKGTERVWLGVRFQAGLADIGHGRDLRRAFQVEGESVRTGGLRGYFCAIAAEPLE